jgi:diguanylate cyclase (GGDEF)-like protein
LGGQQFVILLPGPGDALAIAERIRCRVAATTVSVASPDTQSQFVGVTVSIGVTAHPHDGTTLSPLLEAANRALCEAKAAGHNRAVGWLRSRESPRNQAIVIASSFSRR